MWASFSVSKFLAGWLLSFGTLGSDAKYLVLQALFPVCLKLFGMGFSPFLLVGKYLFLIFLVIGVLILPSFLRMPFLVLLPLFGVLGIPLLAIRFHLLFMFEIIGVASGTDIFCSFFQGHIAFTIILCFSFIIYSFLLRFLICNAKAQNDNNSTNNCPASILLFLHLPNHLSGNPLKCNLDQFGYGHQT